MSIDQAELRQKIADLDEYLLGGIRSGSTDGESFTGFSPADALRIKSMYEQQDQKAVICGKVTPGMYRPRFRGIY